MVLLMVPAGAEVGSVNDVSTLLENKYGLVDPANNAQIARVHQIFDRVQDVADKRGNRMPQLSVVNKSDTPWAIALADGNILLSLGAVNLCYKAVPQTEGDARIAFVLGHELAHLAKNDFWNRDFYLAIAGDGQGDPSRQRPVTDKTAQADLRQRQATAWNKETEADDLGFLYAGIAGYPVQSLFSHLDEPDKNFFHLWTELSQTNSPGYTLHPPPKEREAFLRARLESLAEEISFFNFGFRLAHFGDCEQGISFLRKFLQLFPAREVYNNLGACHLQRAQQEIRSTAVATIYWMPLLFDTATRAEPLLLPYKSDRPRESSVLTPPIVPDKSGHDLDLAVEYFEQAAAADPAYLAARLNLATARFYQGEILKARSALEEAIRIAPTDKEVAGWHALLLYLDSRENGLGVAALPHFTQLANQKDAPLSLLFNHTLLMQKMGRKSREGWARLAGRSAQLPAHYARIVCSASKVPCEKRDTVKGKPLPWPLPVQPGIDLDAVDREKLFAGWRANRLGWLQDKRQGTVYRRGEGELVLDLDGYVAMVVLRGQDLGTSKALKRKLGRPTDIQQVTDGMVWSYGTDRAVLVRNGQVREVWVAQKE
ncbi:MAG: tetratricopeptide repeat protein [Magnetococcales bacterium]|nr:tetratricopeptide repeat protein [Magnetococcales bacterium]